MVYWCFSSSSPDFKLLYFEIYLLLFSLGNSFKNCFSKRENQGDFCCSSVENNFDFLFDFPFLFNLKYTFQAISNLFDGKVAELKCFVCSILYSLQLFSHYHPSAKV